MSASRYKQEYSPLLPKGFHPFDIDGMRTLCVDAFRENSRRIEIMAGFEIIYEELRSAEIPGEIWIDGSFLTKKVEPDDIDFVVMMPSAVFDSGTPEQKALVDWLINNEDDPKKSFRCHTDVGLLYDGDSPLSYLTAATRHHWGEVVFGYSVVSREPKGIAVTLCANMTETSCMTAISEQGGKENQHGNDERFCPVCYRCNGRG